MKAQCTKYFPRRGIFFRKNALYNPLKQFLRGKNGYKIIGGSLE